MLQRLTKQLGDVAHFQSPHQVESMYFHRSHADGQTAGDIAVGIALRHQFQDLFLSRRQSVRSFADRFGRLGSLCRSDSLGRLGGLDRLSRLFRLNSFAYFHGILCPKFYC